MQTLENHQHPQFVMLLHERQQTKVGWMIGQMVVLTVGSMTRVSVDEDISMVLEN